MIERNSTGQFTKGCLPTNKIIIPESQLRELYGQWGSKKIAKKLNVSKQTVLRNLHEYNIPIRLPGSPKEMPLYWKEALRKPKSVPSYWKGKTKQNCEAMRKKAEALTGENHPNWRAEIHKDEKVLCGCGCGQYIARFDKKGRERIYAPMHHTGGRFTSERVSGSNNNHWKGGISSYHEKIRHSKEYNEWRKAIYIKDNYKCRECGKQYRGIIAHHIKCFADYPELRLDVNNGMVLCRSCHLKLHQTTKKTGGGKR